MKTRNYTAAALLALFFGLFGCDDDSAFDSIGASWSNSLPIGSLFVTKTYNVIYDGNGSTGGTVPVDATEYTAGDLVTVLGNPDGLVRYEDPITYSFNGWNTASNGTGTAYTQGSVFVMETASVKLYAQWTELDTFNVFYNGNGNDGGAAPVDTTNYLEDQEVTVLGDGTLTNTGFVFAGWNTELNGTGDTYYPGGSFIMGNVDETLYAVWSDQWAQDAYLKASNAEAEDIFGYSVAVDGSTIVVGAPQEDSNYAKINNTDGSANSDNSMTFSGAAYVFMKSKTGNWVQDAYLKPSNVNEDDYFGSSIAVSGGTIVVGAHLEDSKVTAIDNSDGKASLDNSASAAGAAYVFKRLYDPKTRQYYWVQDAYLKASNANGSDHFGYRVAVDGDTILVGADDEDSAQTTVTNTNGSASTDNTALSSGAVYVYKKDSGNDWYQDAYLKARNAEASDFFGCSIAVGGDTIVVGARGEDSNQTTITNTDGTASANNSASFSGAAYVFKLDFKGRWIQDAYLKASNTGTDDYFGYSIGVSGDTIVVGAYGEDSNLTSITNSDGHPVPAESNDFFLSSGAAYVFKKVSGDWVQDAYLKASNAEDDDFFGYSVAVSGDVIVVGAYHEESGVPGIDNDNGEASGNNDYPASGAAYVFKKDASDNWVQDAYLKASNANASDYFGYSVGVSGYTIVAGAYQEASNQVTITNTDGSASTNNSASLSGAAYVFTIK